MVLNSEDELVVGTVVLVVEGVLMVELAKIIRYEIVSGIFSTVMKVISLQNRYFRQKSLVYDYGL